MCSPAYLIDAEGHSKKISCLDPLGSCSCFVECLKVLRQDLRYESVWMDNVMMACRKKKYFSDTSVRGDRDIGFWHSGTKSLDRDGFICLECAKARDLSGLTLKGRHLGGIVHCFVCNKSFP